MRFGDNMRYVAVTDGDKVAAEARFGFAVNTHGVGDLVETMKDVSDSAIDALCAEYEETLPGGRRAPQRRRAARVAALQCTTGTGIEDVPGGRKFSGVHGHV